MHQPATMMPLHIERLPQDVINRIAAGEVVQRPSAAIKEMLENSIDAGATRIQVVCQDGGLGLLQITDNGCGVHVEDLPMLCERFATSKLRTFEDLAAVSSFGFRGEALASISHVARVCVTTMRHDAHHAWFARYSDGGVVEGPSVHPGNPGTSIRVEDMFYNAPVRKTSLGKAGEEYSRVLSVVQRYSICFPHVAFSCRHAAGDGSSGKMNPSTGSVKFDFTTQVGSTMLLNIKCIYGSSIATHLLRIDAPIDVPGNSGAGPDPAVGGGGDGPVSANGGHHPSSSITGYVSDATLANKKHSLVLFVNQRLVDSTAIRRCLDQVYAPVLTGGNKWVAFLVVTVPQHRVDVNVHPTKHEVMMLDEDAVLRALSECVRRELAKSSAAKQLHVGDIDYRVINLKPVSSSSSNVSVSGHKGVVVAPCTMSRVSEQHGDIRKYAVAKGAPPVPSNAITASEGSVEAAVPLSASSSVPTVDRGTTPTASCVVDVDDAERPPQNVAIKSTHCSVAVTAPDRLPQPPTTTESVVQVPVDREAPATPFHLEVCADGKREREPIASAPPVVGAPMSCFAIVDNEDDDEESDEPDREFKKMRAEQSHKPTATATVCGEMRNAAEGAARMPHALCCGTHSSQSPTEVAALPPSPNDGNEAPAAAQPRLHQDSSSSADMLQHQQRRQQHLSQLQLTSVQQMVASFEAQSPQDLRQLFSKMVFIGIMHPNTFFAQSGTTLFLVKTFLLAQQVAFQRVFLLFGRHAQLSFVNNTAPSLRALLSFAVAHDLNKDERAALLQGAPDGSPIAAANIDKAVSQAIGTLRRWRRMLEEYFCIEMQRTTSHGAGHAADLTLVKMPLLLGDAWPMSHRRVPLCMWRLATTVDYTSEETCLVHVAKVLSEELFKRGLEVDPVVAQQRASSGRPPVVHDAVRFGLLPAATNSGRFFPNMDLLTEYVLRSVVTVEALYKVFERC